MSEIRRRRRRCQRRFVRADEDAVVLIGSMLDRGGGGWGSRVGGGRGCLGLPGVSQIGRWFGRGRGGGDLGVCWGSMLGMTSGWDIQGPGDVVGGDVRGCAFVGCYGPRRAVDGLGMGFGGSPCFGGWGLVPPCRFGVVDEGTAWGWRQ